ncbi:AAA family ATPase [Accumulibacter sp.]|uniref:AAA family ATPase n=1 Tax=Accumulibacter sp. TaxID=2053492 RepID=UPI0026085FF0|nr:AAA family ATPase [Accumulibacter sp.]
MSDITIYEFQPLWLTLDQVGPFQSTPYEIDFTDDKDKPCNVFLLMSENGRGKTTVLECMALLMRQLGEEQPERFGQEDLDRGRGRVQLDVLSRIFWQGRDHRIVLSLLAGNIGEETFLKVWDDADLKRYGAEEWHRSGYRQQARGRLLEVGAHDDLVQDLRHTLIDSGLMAPEGFANSTLSLPTALLFPAYRDIPSLSESEGRPIVQPEHWGYRTVQEFAAHGTNWTASLDNLLVWLKWLDNGSYENAVKTINSTVFAKSSDKFLAAEIRRVPPEAIVHSGGQTHRLDRLSSGEKNLTQLFLRIGAHSTRNTWVLVDELDVHLHVRWQHKALHLMKALVRQEPGTTVIASTHSVEILEAFPLDIREQSLIKGGWIIEEDLH